VSCFLCPLVFIAGTCSLFFSQTQSLWPIHNDIDQAVHVYSRPSRVHEAAVGIQARIAAVKRRIGLLDRDPRDSHALRSRQRPPEKGGRSAGEPTSRAGGSVCRCACRSGSTASRRTSASRHPRTSIICDSVTFAKHARRKSATTINVIHTLKSHDET
jgi:hypothetical protein